MAIIDNEDSLTCEHNYFAVDCPYCTVKKLEAEVEASILLIRSMNKEYEELEQEVERLRKRLELAEDFVQTIKESGIVELNYDNWLGRYLKLYDKKLEELSRGGVWE